MDHPHVEDLPDLPRMTLEHDDLVAGRASGQAARVGLAGTFAEDFHLPADQRGVPRAGVGVDHVQEVLVARFLDLLGDLPGQRGGGRVLARGIPEHEGVVEAEAVGQGARFLVVRVRLAGKADDDVGRHRQPGPGGAQVRDQRLVGRRPVGPVHGAQHAVAAALHGEMDVGHQARQAREGVHQVAPEADGVRRGEAQALQALDGVDGVQELHERAAAVGAFRELVASVEVDDLAEQRDLPDPPRDEPAHLRDDFLQGARAFRAARVGHDAERAAHVAALHDRHEAAALAGPQDVLFDGALGTSFLVDIDDAVGDGQAQVVAPEVLAEQGAAAGERLVHVVGDAVELLGAHDEVDAPVAGGGSQEVRAAALGHAAQEAEDDLRAVAVQVVEGAHLAEGLLFGLVAHAARVEQDHVGLGLARGHLVAARDELAGDLLAVALVHLAAVGFEKDFGHRP